MRLFPGKHRYVVSSRMIPLASEGCLMLLELREQHINKISATIIERILFFTITFTP